MDLSSTPDFAAKKNLRTCVDPYSKNEGRDSQLLREARICRSTMPKKLSQNFSKFYENSDDSVLVIHAKKSVFGSCLFCVRDEA